MNALRTASAIGAHFCSESCLVYGWQVLANVFNYYFSCVDTHTHMAHLALFAFAIVCTHLVACALDYMLAHGLRMDRSHQGGAVLINAFQRQY